MNFGNYVNGDLYFPTGADQGAKKLAAIFWLHPMNPAGGYYPSYRRGDPPHVTLAKAGFAVLAFDQIGQGYRVPEAAGFYGRYPNWSLLGKTVQDIQSAVDALERTALVDAKRIYLVGYGTGAMAALHAAALDDRIAGVVSVAGFTPMRLDNNERSTGGVARWAQWTMLLPRLGGFVGNESRIPYDYHEVLALLAPRRCWWRHRAWIIRRISTMCGRAWARRARCIRCWGKRGVWISPRWMRTTISTRPCSSR